MGYAFPTVKGAVRVKVEGNYPWPCRADGEREIQLFHDDVLTECDDGTYLKRTGFCCSGIILVPEDVEPFGADCELQLK